ncbi:hypothetical protein H9Q10_06530 [Eikenella sp. S3360]|uniref:Pilus assembly protein PilP n=1 Tax=Eikenella glucosivorans TaxID=2766967 RepID=A0ABS0NAJ2_9NEIS|nr:hypothetical protein [Eikenella glucosivorans]MBH5329324.1 hypothetical protein [Eikenella glucosivorans]
MKKYFLVLLLAFSSTVWAYRFPVDSMEVAVLKSASFPQVTFTSEGFSWLRVLTLGWLGDGAKTFDMVQGVRIKDENNRFITHGQLPNYAGKVVALRRNGAGNVVEMWILTPQENEAFKQRAALLQNQQR